MKRVFKVFLISIVLVCFNVSCKETYNNKVYFKNPDWFHGAMQQLTKTMVHDIFSPPVASRIYAYPSIAAYEALVPEHPEYKSLAGQLNGLSVCPKPVTGEVYSYELASLHAFIIVGSRLVFSSDDVLKFEEDLLKEIKQTSMPKDIVERSKVYGEEIANHIINWAKKDNYSETRTSSTYAIEKTPGSWQPTPPAYMAGIEPHWNKIRPFVLDSARQFQPLPPTKYSMQKDSKFYNELMDVYHTGLNLNKEQAEIASFWDCNPYVLHQKGHLMLASKKITPGGHWIGITEIATKKSEYSFMETVNTYVQVSIGIADAFISCWDEKWRSNLIRPETVINEFIDEDWKPLLQTPPFPEHTSGHSVVSSAAATILTHLIGDNFEYEDTSELEYGLPSRYYYSFYKASEEAAISRLYGGIHYMPAIEYGITQGKAVGSFVLNSVSTKKI